ncbi:MAG: hypothetical protein H6728_01475 [Myxococcales bacterium]|nr:hypothetical protein [Myxococcales bacterium]
MQIPRVDENKTARNLNDRVSDFQKPLTDPNRLNEEGYIAIPFDISVVPGQSNLSPATYNHKILYVEAEINSTSKGDDVVARVPPTKRDIDVATQR